MSILNLRTAALAIVAGIGLGGCAYGPYGGLGVGVGYGNGYYDPYYGGGYYGGGYGSRYGYSGYGYGYPYRGYGSSYYGWNNGFYYPGTGYYVYDRYRRPHRWSDAQRRYWERQRGIATSSGGIARVVENWGDFQNRNATTRQRVVRNRPVVTNQQVRTERRQARRSAQQERRAARAEEVQERRAKRGRTQRD